MSSLFVFCFLGGSYFIGYLFSGFFIVKFLFVVFLFLWVRSSYPRLRFDQLMWLGWKNILPVTLTYLFFFSLFII